MIQLIFVPREADESRRNCADCSVWDDCRYKKEFRDAAYECDGGVAGFFAVDKEKTVCNFG